MTNKATRYALTESLLDALIPFLRTLDSMAVEAGVTSPGPRPADPPVGEA
jgi:hypothetical protein